MPPRDALSAAYRCKYLKLPAIQLNVRDPAPHVGAVGIALWLGWSVVVGAQPSSRRGRPTVAAGEDDQIAAPSPPPADAVLPEVAPIIGDDEFEAAIPPISAEDDPELDRPLESIAEFELRRPRRRQRVEPPIPTPRHPLRRRVRRALLKIRRRGRGRSHRRCADPRCQLARVATTENFDVEPVACRGRADRGDVSVAYAVRVNGLQPADDSTDVDLADLFGDLSALYDGDGKADNIAMVRARLTADAELMQRILASEGY